MTGSTLFLEKTAEAGGFGHGNPVGLFNAKNHHHIAMVGKQIDIIRDTTFKDKLKNDMPNILARAKNANDVSNVFKSDEYLSDYMLYSPSGKYYLTKYEHLHLQDVKIPGPINSNTQAPSTVKVSRKNDKGKEVDID